ncbi:MAG: AsmA-like C-terminal region-containing protein [Bacteroidia bacterium]
MNRLLKRIFISISVLVFLLIIILFTVSTYYKEEVKQYVINEVNSQLNTQVIINSKDISFSLLKNFPYASVDFNNLKALDAGNYKKKDTLFNAKKISFQFNLLDIFRKSYHVKKIEVENVRINIHVDENGNDNYHFWKNNTKKGDSNFSFALEKIVLNHIEVVYNNFEKNQFINALINKGELAGKFSNTNYSLKTNSHLFVNSIKIDSVNYINQKNVSTDFTLEVDNQTAIYKIKNGKIKIEDLVFEVGGNIVNNEKMAVDIALQGKNMNIKTLLSLIPRAYKNKIENYKSNGEFYVNATFKGNFSKIDTPEIIANFGIKKAAITEIKEDIVLSDVNLTGKYTNGNKKTPSSLTLIPFSAFINKNAIAGTLSIYNLDNPIISGKIKANIELSELQRFLKIDTIQTISGNLKVDAVFGENKNSMPTERYNDIRTSGDLKINNVNLKLKNNALQFKNITGNFKFNNNDLIVDGLKGNISSSDFELKGFFRNIIAYALHSKEDVSIEASLYSNFINLNELLANKEENKQADSKYKLKFSEHLNVNINTEVQSLKFRKFEASSIKGVIKLQKKKLIMDPISFSTMNGTITANALIDANDSTKIVVTCLADIDKINITQMFYSLENFGQNYIMDKNIKGITTCKIKLSSEFSPQLEMDMNTLNASLDMNIENGELNNVNAMKSLSRFIDLKELENIRFATLKNQIEIKKEKIYFSKMEVKSSAINLTALGTHTFNNAIDYKIKLSLNELLARKAKKAKKENNDFGEVADDGLGRTNLFLSMTGTVEKPNIKYDSKSAVQNVKKDIKEEKQNFKTILKEEFGLFKKDTTLNNKTKKEINPKFKIKWGEADKNKNTEKKELKKPKKADLEEDF